MENMSYVSLESLETYISHLSQAVELGHTESIKRIIHELFGMVQELKREGQEWQRCRSS